MLASLFERKIYNKSIDSYVRLLITNVNKMKGGENERETDEIFLN